MTESRANDETKDRIHTSGQFSDGTDDEHVQEINSVADFSDVRDEAIAEHGCSGANDQACEREGHQHIEQLCIPKAFVLQLMK